MAEWAPPNYVSYEFFDEFKRTVEEEFAVLSSYIELGTPTFIISTTETKKPFKRLATKMKHRGYLPVLRRENGRLILRVIPKPVTKPARVSINIILFMVTLVTVSVSAFFLCMDPIYSNELAPGVNIYLETILVTASVFAIIGLHEFGHFLSCKLRGLEATLPYFIPGIPLLSPLGTFGAVIIQREPTTNRDEMFDLGSSGPIFGFLVSVIVTIIGLQRGFSFTVSETQLEYFAQKYPQISFTYITPPIIMSFLTSILHPYPEGFTLYIGPVAFTAYIGLLITFINLLPTWQLDGGWVSLSVLGEKWQNILSWISVLMLFFLGYWFMAMLVLFGMWKSRAVLPLDNVSSLSSSRKLLSIVLLSVLILSATYTPYA